MIALVAWSASLRNPYAESVAWQAHMSRVDARSETRFLASPKPGVLITRDQGSPTSIRRLVSHDEGGSRRPRTVNR